MKEKKHITIIVICSILLLAVIFLVVGSLVGNHKTIITKYVCADGIVVLDKSICTSKDNKILVQCASAFECCVEEPSISGYTKRACPTGRYCINHVCMSQPACNSNDDCSIALSCVNGECVTETIYN